MKKRNLKSIRLLSFIFIFLVLLFTLVFYLDLVDSIDVINSNNKITGRTVTGEAVTGEVITGEATTLPTDVSVLINVPSSIITIISPKNKTYLKNSSVLVNYSSSYARTIWYNLDLGENTTITQSTRISTSEGGQRLYLYSNNSDGDVSVSNVSFSVNSTKLIINNSEYNDTNKGNSTFLLDYAYEELQNLTNFILENIDSGKIIFNEIINQTDDSDSEDNLIDLDSYTNISDNRIEVNPLGLPNLDKSATLSLYDLSFLIPQILKDGVLCSDCTQVSYSSGILVFSVTGFSVYSARETPSGEEESPGGGGGGGGSPKTDFSVDKETLNIKLDQGTVKTETILIENKGGVKLNLVVKQEGLKNLVNIPEPIISLVPGESKILKLNFVALQETKPDLYLGKIIIEAKGIKKEILVAVDVQSAEPLFDVDINIPSQFKYVLPGEEIMAEISIYNLGDLGKVDVVLDYEIRDEDGNTIFLQQDTRAIETATSFMKSFLIPTDVVYGKYIFYVKTTYQNNIASASEWFNIGEKELPFSEAWIWIFAISVIVLILILLVILFELKRHLKSPVKVNAKIRIKSKKKK